MLRAYDITSDARASIGRYLDFSDRRRRHSSLDVERITAAIL
jgi:putative transposase